MIDRILDLTDQPARLSLRGGLLMVAREGVPDVEVPMGDILAVILAHPGASASQACMAALAGAGGILIVTGEKFLPAAMLMPMESHFTQGERFVKQAAAPLPVKKRLWQTLARAKIRAQSGLLRHLFGEDGRLGEYVSRVKSGDPENIEAQAARRYWPALFGTAFRRDRMADDQNRFLNYGYTVLRASVARAVCAAGLHPSLGVHHHNRFDAFCLADDLMEPFRPLVDQIAYRIWKEKGGTAPLDKETKPLLIGAVLGRYTSEGEERSLPDLCARAAQRLARTLTRESDDFVFPEITWASAG